MRVPSVLAAVCVAFHAFAPAIALADGKAVVATLALDASSRHCPG